MKVGARIKARRLELGMSADELADKAGVSRSTIFRYENGKIGKLPISVLRLIAETLATTPEYLMGWDESIIVSADFEDAPSDATVDIGRRIKKLREKKDISQDQLAEMAGISQIALNSIEKAVKSPSIQTISSIAKALNVPISSLVEEGEEAITELLQTPVTDSGFLRLAQKATDMGLGEEDFKAMLDLMETLKKRDGKS